MSAHTPGPWKLNAEKSSVWKGESIVAAITIGRGATEADAHLIAAAPKMAASLRELIIAAEAAGWDTDAQNAPILNAARAAYAEATGGAA